MSKKISLFSLVLLVVAAIDSIRNLPATAIFGSSLIFFYLFAALIFLIPISLVSAEFSSRYPEEGGVFHWVRKAFGPKCAFITIWLQWINTMAWFPTILSFIAGTFAYLINPALAQNKLYLISVILTVFWGLTLMNLRGINVSAKINSFCGTIGLLIPMAFLIALGIFWVASGRPVQIQFTARDIFPSFSNSHNWVSLIAIMASYLGMELSGVHINDIRDPQKNYPKAMWWSIFILLTTMVLGSLAIAVVIPPKEIRLVDGIMQSFTQFFDAFGISFLVPVLTVLICVGTIGGMINWLVAPSKGLLQAAQFGFLPKYFAQENKHQVPVRLLFAQGTLISIFCFCIILFPSINAFYWFLTALSTELYMFMYIFLFAAALKVGRPKEGVSYRIPRGTRRLLCILGLAACSLTIVIGFFPPEEIKVKLLDYVLMIAAGNTILAAPAFILMRRKRA
jgi:amino acid transporter